jgi:ABC-type sugar transport system ATPase subunit
MNNQAYLKVEKINKTFKGVKALIDVDMEAYKSEVLGIAGINGAGKSTLMNVLAGIVIPESGNIFIDGKKVNIKDSRSAEMNGIAIIHQEAVYFEHMTVAENMMITRLDAYKKGGLISYSKLFDEAREYLKMMGSEISPATMMRDLSTGDRQLVDIVRALAQGASILLFDEPTSSLTTKEKKWLFDVIGKLKQQGKVIIYITHFLEEIMEICDKVLVMRDGVVVKNNIISDIQISDIVNQMFGHGVEPARFVGTVEKSEPLLKVENLNSGKQVKNVSFELYKGEILGFWGLLGSGRTEIMRALLGLDNASGERMILDKKTGKMRKVTGKKLLERCGYITENRHADGLFLRLPIYQNFSMASLSRFKNKASLLKTNIEKQTMDDYIGKLKIAAPNPSVNPDSLSGGNQQKVLVARWIYRRPDFFIFDEPTRGVDIKAKTEIHQNIIKLVEQGNSVILISSEAEEIMNLSSRVLVVNSGRIVAELGKNKINSENLKKLCVGEEGKANAH